MPENKPPGRSHRFSKLVRRLASLCALLVLLAACGEGEAQSTALDIKRAGWRGEEILVTGVWAKGVATPPLCRVLEGRDGPISDDFGRDARVSLDGNAFSKEFVPETTGAPEPDSPAGYYVKCSVGLDSGRSADDAMKVENAS
ncbi:MAG: hypothetical protein ACFB50_13605 [Rubrobacteraceae bacterium]